VRAELVDDVEKWMALDPDEADRATLRQLLDQGDEAELELRFAAPLAFGTAGLRGPVRAGPAGMNRLTVRRATLGVIAWMHETGIDTERGVVVGRDARNGSEKFNDEVVAVLLGSGIPVIEMPRPLPTPLVAYAVKALEVAAGIMITASHNPPKDNGYKLYGPDGSQIIAPNDEIVERHMSVIGTPLLGDRSSGLHRFVAEDLLIGYRAHFVSRFGVPGASGVRITYTPLHGVGGETMTILFREAGFRSVSIVETQFTPDGRFPTLPFPNPEEPGALDLAMAHADETSSSLVIANDPDADRLGAAVRGGDGWHILRGDQIGWLLASSMLPAMDDDRDVVATTIVSSTLLEAMAAKAHVRFAETLTGFKWVARAAGDAVLRFGYEEALGFAVDPVVGDKDGMSAALALCQLAHQLSTQGQSLLDRLDEIEEEFGVHAGAQLALRSEGPAGLVAIRRAVDAFRASPPTSLGGIEVTNVVDFAKGWHGFEATDAISLELGTRGRVVVRPSGTEPKLKAYIEIRLLPDRTRPIDQQRREASSQLDAVRTDLASLLKI
jgi:phosphomannomutase